MKRSVFLLSVTLICSSVLAQNSKHMRQLRNTYLADLRPSSVRKMIAKHDFMCTNSAYSSLWSNAKSRKITNYIIDPSGYPILIDTAAHLMWQQGGSPRMLTVDQVEDYVKTINALEFGGYNDWRLPTLEEAMSTMSSEENNGSYVGRLLEPTQTAIWTGDKLNADTSWVVRYDKGRCNYGTYKYSRYVRLVRSIDNTQYSIRYNTIKENKNIKIGED